MRFFWFSGLAVVLLLLLSDASADLSQGTEGVGIIRLFHRDVNRSRMISQGCAHRVAESAFARVSLASGFVIAHCLPLQCAIGQEARFIFTHVLALSKDRYAALGRAIKDTVAIWACRIFGVKCPATAFATYCMCGGRRCQHHAKECCSDSSHVNSRWRRNVLGVSEPAVLLESTYDIRRCGIPSRWLKAGDCSMQAVCWWAA